MDIELEKFGLHDFHTLCTHIHTVYPPVIIFEENSLIRKKQLFTGARDILRVSYLFIFFLNQLVLRIICFGHIFVLFFTLFQETYLPGFIARHYMILFRCLVTLRIRESQSVEFLLMREITDDWNGKTVAYSSFKIRVCHSRSDAHSISMTYLISKHFNSIILCLY